jgi:hypothetical protein
MSKTRKELVTKFINEGFTYRTLSSFSDEQLTELGTKLFTEQSDQEIEKKESELADLYNAKADALEENDDTEELTPNNEPIVKVEKDGKEMTLLGDEEIQEDGEENPWAICTASLDLVGKKRDNYSDNEKSKFERCVKKVKSEQVEVKMLENWIMSLVEKRQQPEITKSDFIKTIKENFEVAKVEDKPFILSTEEQESAFDMVTEIGNEMLPPMTVVVDDIDDGHLNGYLKSDDNDKIIKLNICPMGEVKLDGNPIGDLMATEVLENEGSPSPVETPTIAPTKPGEKKRRGPFQKPKVTPKPKAKKTNSTLPDWLTFTNLGKLLTDDE